MAKEKPVVGDRSLDTIPTREKVRKSYSAAYNKRHDEWVKKIKEAADAARKRG